MTRKGNGRKMWVPESGMPGSGHAMVSSVVSVPKKAKSFADLPEYMAKIAEIFKVYRDVLGGKLTQDPPVRTAFEEARIPLKQGYRARRHRHFQTKGERKQAMVKILKEFLERCWIQPFSSKWTSPCFVVLKNVAEEWRVLVDYRNVNSESQDDAYCLPLIHNLLLKQQGKRMFSVLQLKHGYHRMLLAKSSQKATAMPTSLGLMRWNVMPMRVRKGNAQFQRMAKDLLRDLDCADPFMDDINGTLRMADDQLTENHLVDPCRVIAVFGKQGAEMQRH